MNDELIYYPTSELVKGCCNGDIDVHHPLTLENRLGDKRVEMLFVDHLLNNSKNEKVPFIKVLSTLRNSIKDETSKLIEDNSFVKHLVDSSIKEWRRDISPYEIFHSDIDDDEAIDQSELFDYSKLTNESNETNEMKKKITELEKILKEKRERSENGILEYSDDTDRNIRELYQRSTKCKNRIEGHLGVLNKIKNNIDPKHNHLLMDLGMKNKSEYMKFFKGSNESPITYYLNDRNSIGIPKNIQTVFTNYTLINNLIHKELDYIQYKMNELKKISDENNRVMKDFVSGLDTQDYINDIYEPENPEDTSEEEDEDETIKKYVIREDKDDEKEDNSESLLSRLSSYFTGEEEQRLTDKDKKEIANIIQEKDIDREINDKINNEPTLFADAGDNDDY
jgi:hypothetical protein